MSGIFAEGRLSGLSIAILVLFCLIVIQSVGGYLQIKDYQKAIRRMRKLGNVGVGQRRGRFPPYAADRQKNQNRRYAGSRHPIC